MNRETEMVMANATEKDLPCLECGTATRRNDCHLHCKDIAEYHGRRAAAKLKAAHQELASRSKR